jgi:uncharacterized protein (DUF433 family)
MALPNQQHAELRRVVHNPRILDGEPTLDGTRVPVRTVAEASRLGMTVNEIVDAYPMLDRAAVETALAYYRLNRDEIERHIAENGYPAD